MTDELVKRLQLWEEVFPQDMDKEEGHLYQEAAERIKALTADKRFIIEERDRTFALMLARAEKAESERDEAYAKGYSDAETEISKSALGQGNAFLHSQYANAVEQIKDLNELLEEAQTEWSKYASSWMTAEGKLADAEALIEAQTKDHASNNIRFAEAEHRAKTAESDIAHLHKLLAEAASDLTACVDAEYPPDTRAQHPDIARRHHRDMELVRRIEAVLKGASHE